MSESILRLRVESQEYDNKIKRAAEGIQQYAQKCREAGGTLSFLDDGVLEFVQSLGQMDTVAKGSRQQMRELSNALTTLTTTYRGLTEEEKASPFGVELARGIDTLTERAGAARDAMSDVEQSIKNASSDTRTFDQLAQGMSVATAGFQGLTGAGKLLGIEMGNDVEVIAKLQAAMAVTNSLTTIQTALQKQSALMQGLNAAKTALATASQQAYAVATGEATVAQTAFNVVASANPYALLLTAAGALVGVIAAFASTTGESTEEVKDAKKEMDSLAQSVNVAAEAYDRLKDKVKSLGIGGQKEYQILRQSKKDQYDALNEQISNVGYNMRFYEKRGETDSPIYKELQEEHKKIKEEAAKIKKEIDKLDAANKDRISRINQYKRLDFSDISTQAEAESAISFLKEQIKYVDNTTAAYKQLQRAIKYAETTVLPEFKTEDDRPSKTISKPKKVSKKEEIDIDVLINNEYPDVAQAEGEGLSYGEQLMQGILTGMANKMQDADTNMLKNLLQVVVTNGLDVDIPTNDLMERILGDGEDIPDAYWDDLAKTINEKLAELNLDPIELNFGTGEVRNKKEEERKSEDPMKTFQKGVNGVTSILSGIQQMGMKLPDGLQQTVSVIQGLISVIEGVHTIISLFSTTSMAANTAAVVANTAALTFNSATNAIPFFAHGGIVPHAANGYFVPGNSFSGDTTPIMANAGELVLNESQQGVLASRLSDVGGMRNIQIAGRLEGETIALVVDRFGKRTGKGELAFFKN